MKSWQKLVNSGFFKGFLMFLPAVLFGSFSFVALKGLNNMLDAVESAVPKAYARHMSEVQARRKGKSIEMVGTQDSLNSQLQEKLKKPAGLDSAKPNINSEFKAQQEYSLTPPPSVNILSKGNPDPKNTKISNILNKFKNLISSIWSDKFEVKKVEDSLVVEDIDTNVDESSQSKKSEVKLSKLNLGDKHEGLLPHYDKNIINYLYSLSFNSENVPERPNKAYSKLVFNLNLLAEAREFLKSTSYNDLDIIDNEIINPEILQLLGDKFNLGIEFSKLERIIADVFVLSGDGSKYVDPSINNEISYGTVNSESLSNENSFEKTEQNIARLKVLSESMSGIPGLQPGAVVPMRLMPEGTQYKKGDIIVFYRDEIKIIHQVEYFHESNGEIFYVTTGVNTETNQYVDSDLVSQDDVIGVVDLSKEAYLELNEMMARRYVRSIQAFGMTLESANILKEFVREKSTYLRNALKNAMDEASKRGLILVSPNDPNKELSFEEFTMACIESYNPGKNKFYGDALLTWKHVGTNNDGCGKIYTNTYNNLRDNIGNCKYCDSPWKNQQKTHKILEALFGQIFSEEVYLKDIDDIIYDIENNPIYEDYLDIMDVLKMRLDDFLILNLKDQNGEFIKLAIESQGPQHYENERGWKSFLFFNNFKGVKEDLEWIHLRMEWKISFKRDKLKQLAFENNQDKGYYLIAVNNDLSAKERVDYIIERLFDMAGIDLSYLVNNNNIKNLLKIIK